jgi:phosphoglycolate phosphatase-like HAD superfamily hydrolase
METARELGYDIEKIIWDADNTFWNWTRYAARAYQAMADTIASSTHLPVKRVEEAMKAFYTVSGTLEDAGLIQGLESSGLFARNKYYNKESLIKGARRIFSKIRTAYFKKYENIGAILEITQKNGIENIVVTDAPRPQAIQRFIRAQLVPYISRLYTMPTKEIKDLPDDVLIKMERGGYQVPFDVIELNKQKPDIDLVRILKLESESKKEAEDYIRKHVAISGDNYGKDMAMAIKWGCLGLHALWGEADPEDIATIMKFAPAVIASRNVAIDNGSDKKRKNIIPVKKPEQILDILELR